VSDRVAAGIWGITSKRATGVAAIAAVFGVAALLRFSGIRYGLPQLLDPDEPICVDIVVRMLDKGSLRPRWYGWPGSTLIDLLFALYGALATLGTLFGGYDGISDAVTRYRVDGEAFILAGRALCAFISSLAVLVVYRALRKVFDTIPSLLGAALLALSPGIVSYSQIIRIDVLLVLFLVLVVHYSIDIARGGRRRCYVLAGAALGLATVSKYPGVTGCAIIGLAALQAAIDRKASRGDAFGGVALAAAASLAAAFLAAPYLFLDFGTVLADVRFQARPYHLGATSAGFGSTVGYYLAEALPAAVGWPACVCGVLGLGALTVDRDLRSSALFFVVFLAFISALSLRWFRWTLPMVPFLCFGVACLAAKLHRLAGERKRIRAAAIIAFALVVLVPPATSATIGTFRRATNADTRVKAQRWLLANVERGSTVLVEGYAPHLSTADYDIRILHGGEVRRWTELDPAIRVRPWYGTALPDARFLGSAGGAGRIFAPGKLRKNGVRYVVLADWVDRYRAEKSRHRKRVRRYDAVLDSARLVAEFTPGPGLVGRRIRVLELPGP
jgi:hypothetical protein